MSATTINDQTAGAPPEGSERHDAERARRFYDRLRQRVHAYAEARGKGVEKATDFLLLVPDIFMLLVRLATDSRVNGKNKVLLGSGIAYYFFPLDIVPELFLGPIGFIDDLLLGVYILNKMLTDTDPEILREHWSGHGDLLETIQKVLGSADQLAASDVLAKIKKMVK